MFIRDELFNQYNFDTTKQQQIRKRLDDLLAWVHSKDDNVINVFTTNYDSVVERGLATSDTYEVVDGFRDTPLEPAEWDPSLFDAVPSLQKIRVNLFKLHGSLSWRADRYSGKTLLVDTEEKAASKRFGENILIYPASKLAPIKEPFGTLYGYLIRKLETTRKCIAIGFSFRDSYLNTAFVDFLRRDPRNLLCVISPSADECARNLFERASSKEIPDRLIQQVITRTSKFEEPDTQAMIYAIMTKQT